MKELRKLRRWAAGRIRADKRLVRIYYEDGATFTATKIEGRIEGFRAVCSVIDATLRQEKKT